jgi:hypothetical protein
MMKMAKTLYIIESFESNNDIDYAHMLVLVKGDGFDLTRS